MHQGNKLTYGFSLDSSSNILTQNRIFELIANLLASDECYCSYKVEYTGTINIYPGVVTHQVTKAMANVRVSYNVGIYTEVTALGALYPVADPIIISG